MEDTIYFIWLSRITEITQVEKRNLLKKYNIKELWNLRESECINVLKSESKAKALLDKKYKVGLEKDIEYIKNNNIELITMYDKRFPINLKNIYDFPVIFYAKGNVNLLNNLSIAIVGSRNPSDYGKKISQIMGFSLAKNNINVISGLAKGIDSFSHIGALKAKGVTIAVMGTGIDIVYPNENKFLRDKIIDNNGVIITEYPIGTKPIPNNFPTRNRIISGLSDGVLVVEATKRSGSLITVNCALEQGKNVYAIPGNITSPNSIGTNELIKEGAKLVTNVEDILEEYKI